MHTLISLNRRNRGILRRRLDFPSYSWTGWKGGLAVAPGVSTTHIYESEQWLEEYTWIVWYKRSLSGLLTLVWDPSANESFPFDDLSCLGYRKRRPFHCPPGVSVNSTRTYPTDLDSNSMPKIQYLFFSSGPCLSIFPSRSTTLLARHVSFQQNEALLAVSLDGVEDTVPFTSQDTFEFILLSRPMKIDVNPGMSEDHYFVMLPEWHGPIAERRGLEYFDSSAVADCFPLAGSGKNP